MAIEKELKYALDRTSYNKLLKQIGSSVSTTEEHQNIYFDTPDFELREKGIGLRIRITNKTDAVLTLKYNAQTTKRIQGYKVREEFNCEFDLKNAKALLKDKVALSEFENAVLSKLMEKTSKDTVASLKLLGTLKNTRTKFNFTKDILLEIDKSTIPGETFYELEAETGNPKEVDKKIREFLGQIEIEAVPSNRSKIGRLFKAISN